MGLFLLSVVSVHFHSCISLNACLFWLSSGHCICKVICINNLMYISPKASRNHFDSWILKISNIVILPTALRLAAECFFFFKEFLRGSWKRIIYYITYTFLGAGVWNSSNLITSSSIRAMSFITLTIFCQNQMMETVKRVLASAYSLALKLWVRSVV